MTEPKRAIRRPLATGLQLAGLALASLGLGVVAIWLGILVAGAGLIALGIAFEVE